MKKISYLCKIMKTTGSGIIERMKALASQILPAGASLMLYGSRARGDSRDDSDWDVLIILDKEKADNEDYDSYAFPFCMLGADLAQSVVPLIYGRSQWRRIQATPFAQNVRKEGIRLI